MTARDPEPICDPTALVADTARLGAPGRRLQQGDWDRCGRPTTIGARCEIKDFCVVGEEAEIRAGAVLDCYSWVDVAAIVGTDALLTNRAYVGARAVVGDRCIIAAHICERSRVGAGSRVFGSLIHRQLNPTTAWDAPESQEQSPILEEDVFVGWGASVVGGVVVGPGSYVCAGALVTQDVKPGMIVFGVNGICRPEDWPGPLGESPFFDR